MSEPLVAIHNDCEAFSTLDSGAEFERVPINYLVHQTGRRVEDRCHRYRVVVSSGQPPSPPSELAVFDAGLYVRVRRFDEPA